MKAKILILVFCGALLPFAALADKRVSLIIYVDLSSSMNVHRAAVAEVAEYITSSLETKCGKYQVAVSNIQYSDIQPDAGEIIAKPGEPLFITDKTENGKTILKQRISIDNDILSYKGVPPYAVGTHEVTYSSVVNTLQSHLMRSPFGLQGSDAVGVMILTDALPLFESYDPNTASRTIRSQLGGIPFMSGAVATTNSQCSDSPYMPESQSYKMNMHKVGWLKNFSDENSGYQWDMCEDISTEDSIKDFILMLMDLAKCQLTV